ncbi:type II secretion system protein M [Alteromonas sediminis]|uniref:Type II secretion system protein M n=1 Tax=Alteromonas sediminis TaxID=2259342 RepID=A0A3N5ZAU3_9ALTE|nr:type II secretion system protein M [Alteromonas sediminis]RPJ66688.1 type II secretion system protein M [Alteromonas sediminis]
MNELKARFIALSEREQKLVVASGVAVVIALFYFIVWQPLNNAIETEQTKLKSQQSLLNWVTSRSQRAQLLRASSATSGGFNGSLPQAVNTTTNRHNIAISRMQPQGDDLQVWIDEAAFNDLLSWLQSLERMGVQIKQVDITDAEKSGHIQVRRLQLGKA